MIKQRSMIQGIAATLTPSPPDSQVYQLTSCAYKTLGLPSSDPNYAATGTNCSLLPSLGIQNSTQILSKVKMTNLGLSRKVKQVQFGLRRKMNPIILPAETDTGSHFTSKAINSMISIGNI